MAKNSGAYPGQLRPVLGRGVVVREFVVLIEFADHVQEAGATFEDSHGRAVLLHVHNSGHAVIRVNGGKPLGFVLGRENLQVDEVIRNPDGTLARYATAC